jgi:hypothetical protein
LEAALDLNIYEPYKKEILSSVTTVIDIGVSDGVFLNRSAKYFPDGIRRIGIDPIVYSDYPRWKEVEYYHFAVTNKCGITDFYETEDKVGSSINNFASNSSVDSKRMECFLTELNLVQNENFFVKLDTQGSEFECLWSFGELLGSVIGIQIEVWLKPFGGVGQYFSTAIAELDRLGFYVCEIFDPVLRPTAKKLGQVDLFCLRKSHVSFLELEW